MLKNVKHEREVGGCYGTVDIRVSNMKELSIHQCKSGREALAVLSIVLPSLLLSKVLACGGVNDHVKCRSNEISEDPEL